MSQLITKADILTYRPTAALDDDRINPFILESQECDLKPVLNAALYLDFTSKFDQTGDSMYDEYQELLNGADYDYLGETIHFSGVKPMLAYYSLARFIQANPVNITRFGVVTKTEANSTPVDPQVLRGMINDLRSVAMGYQNELISFLCENSSTYPLYNYQYSDNVGRKTSYNFFKL